MSLETKLLKGIMNLNNRINYMATQIIDVGLPIGDKIYDCSIDIYNKIKELDDVIGNKVIEDFENSQKMSEAILDLALMKFE